MIARRLVLSALALSLVLALPAVAQTGTVNGQITDASGKGIPDVLVEIPQLGLATTTDGGGNYRLDGVAAGTQTLVISLGDARETASVEVSAGETTTANQSVDWEISFLESITVTSASRRAEKITEAPAAVTVVTSEDIAREGAHGQVPKLLEFTPGAEITQSGIYDFNLNTRGFNSSLNRRVATVIDGREPSVPFLGAQEWAAISFPLDDIERLEMVRGPSAALYGANASSGVLNLTTKAPRDSQGFQVRLTAGELSTANGDVRWAGGVGGENYLKLMGGYHSSGDFSKSRRGAAEYSVPCAGSVTTDCLPQELSPLVIVNDNEIAFGGARLDSYFGEANVLSFEGGYSDISGPLFQTGIGRVQLTDVQRPWVRANFNAPRFNLLGYWNSREATDQRALASNTPLFLDEENYSLEAQTNWEFMNGRARVVAGASYGEDDIDSANDRGVQTLVFEPINADFTAFFAQLDFELRDNLKLVIAGRYDDSSLHDAQTSPKASLVWGIRPNHSLRFSYNEAFQVANYSEFFLQANVAAPLNLSPFEAICAQARISCGFGSGATRVLAVGNSDLEVEETKTIEVGYTGILGQNTFLTLDYYSSENENFITDLLPNVGTSLGRLNSNFGPYTPPANLPAPLAAALLAALQRGLGANFFALSNNFDGTPVLVARTYTNFGDVDTQGVDLGLTRYNGPWRTNLTYSWFDFDIKNAGAFGSILLPNSPPHKASIGLAYTRSNWDLAGSLRWVDEFRWVVGPFQGQVRDYYTVDLSGTYRINDNWKVGATIANATDNEHWESFGGDLLRRRALAFVQFGL